MAIEGVEQEARELASSRGRRDGVPTRHRLALVSWQEMGINETTGQVLGKAKSVQHFVYFIHWRTWKDNPQSLGES